MKAFYVASERTVSPACEKRSPELRLLPRRRRMQEIRNGREVVITTKRYNIFTVILGLIPTAIYIPLWVFLLIMWFFQLLLLGCHVLCSCCESSDADKDDTQDVESGHEEVRLHVGGDDVEDLHLALIDELVKILSIASTRKETDIIEAAVRACDKVAVHMSSVAMEDAWWPAGGGKALVAVLQAHAAHKHLARAACKALCQILFRPEHKMAAKKLGAVQAVQRAKDLHPNDPVTQIEVKYAMRYLEPDD